ncbi:hypothetical protein FQN54_004236 [Arachnomyces sp. PD_36]|nr:hypothetical protein FQN54_004236 [Arachnomyces sp. PD_36]
MAPDGFSRLVMAVNGQFPGPTIRAGWGDTLRIHVTNSLQDNGTSIHWHGIRQVNTNDQDGVSGITECPLAPGDTKTYEFLCTQFGTSWYHSHHSAQYGDGILGPMVIDGPASANYDVDLGPMPIQDWYYRTAYQNALISQTPGAGPPSGDNGLINGTMVSQYGGEYHVNTVERNRKYRLRLINTSLDNHFKVHLDNHNFTVITSDFVPLVPYETDWLFIGIGERYDVIIETDQPVGNYWFRAEVQDGCGDNLNNQNIMSIFRYEGAPEEDPTSARLDYVQGCADETQLVPYVERTVPREQFEEVARDMNVTITNGVNSANDTVVMWQIDGSMVNVDWDVPTLQYIMDGNTSYPDSFNLIELPDTPWIFWVIHSIPGVNGVTAPHPMHVHGHDFYVLGTGDGVFSDPSVLKFDNPPRRDVAMLPALGWLVLAFETNNPGAWLMHCHIAWHVGEGLGVQFVEGTPDDILPALDVGPEWQRTCDRWNDYWTNSHYPAYVETGSGI